jgi:hypothetical protein
VRAGELPDLVREYARWALPAQRELPSLVRLKQTGEMQLKPGRWLPFEATQEIRVDRVEFSWFARFAVAPLVSVRVHDWFRDGEGGLDGRVFRFIPVASAGGPEAARSEAMRYLAELPWCPHAILGNRDLEWRDLEPGLVEVAARVGSAEAAVTLHFDAAGRIAGASASDRPRQEGKQFVQRTWAGEFADYRELGGVSVPTTAQVSWELPEGRFIYFRGRVTRLCNAG